ncbi:glycoside hydrolase family 88 protein [Hymenobacter sp. BT188]|uniref:glycoside hydrolase family 88 protein n=1 Tax=Hymenobacter sp. BT188 TaxID=2763504 RepID=UPI001651A97B|nr:glycoside hydrolase family 88 protein [Hymenobacter sp. BT188]MBC6608850.1 glycoside hydrolase family 88 protein [Hymenobacter sp. BT188]
MGVQHRAVLFLSAWALSSQAAFAQKATAIPVEAVIARAEKQYTGYFSQYPDSTKFPRSTKEDGTILLTSSRNWTSGFFAGNLWYMARLTNQESWRRRAAAWTETLEAEKNTTSTHDLGFIINNSFGQGYALTQNPKYKEVVLQASTTLVRRFSPTVGAIRSWDFAPFTYPVIVDNLMNLELLLSAAKLSGDPALARIAKTHATTDLKYRFRKDYSTFHVLDFDPATGQLRQQMTHQGLADNSCWARGQAWAIYGYTMLYRFTRDKQYLAAAQHAADYFIQHTNKIPDHIPYWDFNDPAIPHSPRDASAAAVAASGLLELSKYSKSPKKYQEAATAMLSSLCTPQYLAAAGTNNFFLLKHSTGNKPSNSEIDVPLVYADYYFLEALWRYKNYATLALQ